MAFKKHAGSKKATPEPEGHVRRSQTVGTYGPGAPIDLLHQAVLVGGLDFWQYGGSAKGDVIKLPRLRDAVAAKVSGLSVEAAFRAPPEGDDKDPSVRRGIHVLEFPTWFVCQNPSCRALERARNLEQKNGRRFHLCADRKQGSECVPIRFVGACVNGHLQDFPWRAFAHMGGEDCGTPRLRVTEGASGDFSDIFIECTSCHARRPLSSATSPDFPLSCNGKRPWLGSEGNEECEEHLRLLVRTASNAYFSQTMSALAIPEVENDLHDRVSDHWEALKSVTLEALPTIREFVDPVKYAFEGVTDDDLYEAIVAKREDRQTPRERLRTAEYRQLTASPEERPGDLAPLDAEFYSRTISTELPRGIAKVVAVSKLREVRTQIGFTRIEAVSADLQGEYDLDVRSCSLGLTTDWLPATELRGEGTFIELDADAVAAWEQRPAVIERGEMLLAGHEEWVRTMQIPDDQRPSFPGVRFYMLHSLSHMLITAISLECGYAASSIRERIYCEPANDELPMAAILLSTGTTGSEGTLGGLVEQGRRIGDHLRRAYDMSVLCSHDPVCAKHSPQQDPAERYLEGAACHGCLFVAECSCERFNRYLDRALVVPTITHGDIAFFAERP